VLGSFPKFAPSQVLTLGAQFGQAGAITNPAGAR
jgi:hypothetical protein